MFVISPPAWSIAYDTTSVKLTEDAIPAIYVSNSVTNQQFDGEIE